MTVEVVGLGAWCDIDDSAPGSAWLTGGAGRPREPIGEALDFRVEEIAMLSDGRRLTLTSDRGWTSWLVGEPVGDTPWAHLTAEGVEETARTVVLPDDVEVTGETHTWARLAESLQDHGIEVTVETLKLLPYTFTFSQRLQERLPAAG
ncbi:hypothetical protein [Frankia sp. AgB32]|uniref:hypothetical protein n=1 Tax=Frankia sp. AgB32 TaxID=631119 RepID=UPI00200E421D|nr:hypothetical protein [Frankia sp. AgB32]MCK9897278.1 hypothetical protein [Frankia sp. AgB32]